MANRNGLQVAIGRRQFVALAGFAALGALGLGGCEYNPRDPLGIKSKTGEGSGFASDAGTPAGGEMTLVAYVDSYMGKMTDGDSTLLDGYMKRYRMNADRGGVTLDVHYTDTAELRRMAEEGFPEDADLCICDADTMDAACENETLYGGIAQLSVRNFGYQLPSYIRLLKLASSDVKMPKADTVTGADASDGSTTRIKNLAQFKGTIAIAQESAFSGKAARRALNAAQVDYADDDGSFYKGFEDVFVSCKTDAAAIKALQNGKVDAAFVLSRDQKQLKGVEVLWDYNGSWPLFEGASVKSGDDGAIARDVLEFIAQCS